MTELTRVRKEAGRRGGLATLARYGVDHFRVIGRKGARVFHSRYRLDPVGLDDFAIVNRETNEVKAFLSGAQFVSYQTKLQGDLL
jgi:hypothetical protein